MDQIIEDPNNLNWNDLQPRGNPANFSVIQVIQSQPSVCQAGDQQMISTSSALISNPNRPQNQDCEQFVNCIIEMPHLAQQQAQHNEQFKTVFALNSRQKKNTNITKFFVSAFEKEIKRLNSLMLISEDHIQFLERAKKKYASRGRRNIKMSALKILFGEENEQITRKNRRIFHELLGSQVFKNYVAKNQFAQQHNKKQHLIASKVYRLRCFCPELTGRTQTRKK